MSAGAQVVGQQDRGHGRARHARLALPGQVGDDPVADVADVGDPLGHEAAQGGEHVHELLGRLHGGDGRRRARIDPRCSTAERTDSRSRASPAVVESASALDPRGGCRPLRQPPRHRLGSRDEAGALGGTLGLGHVRLPLGRELHGAGRPDHGPQDGAGDHGGSGEHDRAGGRREGGGAGGGRRRGRPL